MPAPRSFDYALLRVVPRVERGEFFNAGIVLACASRGFLKARIELDERRLLALDPAADVEAIRGALAAIPVVCAGGAAAGAIGRLSLRERFDWLVAPRSTILQPGPVHSGLCEDPEAALDRIVEAMVR